MKWILLFVAALRTVVVGRTVLAAENLALRQQLAVLRQSVKRPKLKPADRVFWTLLLWCCRDWRNWLCIVQPDTVVRWHRQGFRLYWRWKSGRKPGRPTLPREVVQLIRQMSRENSTWGAPRIQSELSLLGNHVAEASVAKYMARSPKPPSPTWKSFLKNHAAEIAAIDFFVVPTATFRLLYCFVALHHESRRVLHFNVTQHPTARWTAQQMAEAFPFDKSPTYLLRDRDSIYGDVFRRRVRSMGIEEVLTAHRSPWQNPFIERVIGSIRRECLDHVIVLNERHLTQLLTEYFDYYHDHRTHLSLDRNSPHPREIEPPDEGEVVSLPLVGGLHHRYTRRAA